MIRRRCSLFFLICLTAAFLNGSVTGQEALPRDSKVIFVADGDTIQLQTGNFVRLLGIDTPEKGQEYYAKAKDYVRKTVLGKRVTLEYGPEERDDYGRLLAYVWVEQGGNRRCLNEELLSRGLAHIYFVNKRERHREEFLLAQREAILLRRGLWKLKLVETEHYYISSDKSHVFHRPRCRWARFIRYENIRFFFSKEDAYLEGLSPCRSCQP
ncbi:MAG TPA: thermonuclease family protein [Candidatus Mcinerneyibacteriales bacterium]|jgi:micrococcal nuclease|nr:thermonuclease family protein [Candidatus Mcinerneyibacteriales bacterium]HPJ70739.1 thermonuclease family protein [Candidatus Mcinerneyibacteriales bacterium]HPQ90051.1 thermonuclease family protein [Candidatus Mcinerneyibacteriales bacterium]